MLGHYKVNVFRSQQSIKLALEPLDPPLYLFESQQTEFLKKQWLIKHVKSFTEIYHHTTKYLGIANFLSQLATHLDKSYSCIIANSPMIVMVHKIMLIQALEYQNKRNLKHLSKYGK